MFFVGLGVLLGLGLWLLGCVVGVLSLRGRCWVLCEIGFTAGYEAVGKRFLKAGEFHPLNVRRRISCVVVDDKGDCLEGVFIGCWGDKEG